ncbi:MAG: gliding motility-associated-like protein [Flavobacteriales bacterium]
MDPTKPKPAFTQTEEEGCVPLTVYFTNESKYANNYRWTFGDGNSSQRENPKHTYTDPGVYTVSLVASGPGGSDVVTKNQLIKVREYAVAFFTLNPQYPEEVYKDREPVDFFNFSEKDSIWLWDFGDGQGSGEENPFHYYSDIGTFDVQLIANNYYNCPDTFKITTAVNVVAGGRLQMPNAFTPNPNGSNGGVTSDMMLSNDVFFPFFDKVEKFHMQIFNRWGEFIFESFDIDLGWDGYFNGVICPQDVYVYKVEVVYPGGETDVLVGDVTLLK